MYFYTGAKNETAEHRHSERNTLHQEASDQDSSRNSLVRSTSPDTLSSLEDVLIITTHRQLQDNEIDLGSLYMHGARRTGTDLVNMEQGVGTPSLTHRSSVTDVSTSQPHPVTTMSIPAHDQMSNLLHEHDFYAEGWFQDLITGIFLLVIENAVALLVASAFGTSNTIQALVGTFVSFSSWLTILYLYVYVWNCIEFHLHPAKLDKWIRLLKVKRLRNLKTMRWFWLMLLVVLNYFTGYIPSFTG
jgi:hypothetical protein